MTAHYLGLDMGGTNVKAGVTDRNGKLLAHLSVSTGTGGADLAPDKVIARMIDAGEQAIAQAKLKKSDIAAVGVLAPGQASLVKGTIVASANLPLWKNVKLRAKISKGLGLPAVLENDANAAAYGEWWAGAGKPKNGSAAHVESLFIFTLGTGVGGGIVYQDKIIHGASDFAAEIGHMIMFPGGSAVRHVCGCGQRGCLETYTSAGYIAKHANAAFQKSPKLQRQSSLGAIFKAKGAVSAADIAQQAQKGDRFAAEIFDHACYVLAIACINVCHFIDPEMIVLGGGMAQAGKFLLDSVDKHFTAEWWKMTPPTAKIALAKLGNDAGVIGAAGAAKQAADHHGLPKIGT